MQAWPRRAGCLFLWPSLVRWHQYSKCLYMCVFPLPGSVHKVACTPRGQHVLLYNLYDSGIHDLFYSFFVMLRAFVVGLWSRDALLEYEALSGAVSMRRACVVSQAASIAATSFCAKLEMMARYLLHMLKYTKQKQTIFIDLRGLWLLCTGRTDGRRDGRIHRRIDACALLIVLCVCVCFFSIFSISFA